MSSTRVPKIEDFLKKEISQIISSQVNDPRYKFLNVVDVKCSTDLGVAKVFFTIINGDISDSPDSKSLEKFASMVRSKLSKFIFHLFSLFIPTGVKMPSHCIDGVRGFAPILVVL